MGDMADYYQERDEMRIEETGGNPYSIDNKPDPMAEDILGDSESPELHSKSKGFKSVTSTSSNADLNFGILERPSVWPPRPYDVCLVAPTEKIAKLWRKQYPGFEVLTQRKYRGYDLPKDYGKAK